MSKMVAAVNGARSAQRGQVGNIRCHCLCQKTKGQAKRLGFLSEADGIQTRNPRIDSAVVAH
jgi:hypothetical protein